MSPFVHQFLSKGIVNNASVFAFLLRDLGENDARWAARPDPNRFSLREVVAHLVDYDSVSRERFEAIISGDQPELPDWNETIAAEHYATRNPAHQLESLQLSRRELGDWLMGLSEREWQSVGSRPRVGKFSVGEGVAFMLGHDAYHLAQVVEWVSAK